MKENIVYKITNKTNGKYYYGSTDNVNKRMKKHFKLYVDTIKQNNDLHLDIKKLGFENFDVEIINCSNDKVEMSRIESQLIRKNIGDKKMYNKCYGASGRRVFYYSDIKFIRELYNTKTMTIEQAYEKYYKDIVTFRAFKKVWHGDTFIEICPHVFTKENKEWYFAKGQSRPFDKNGKSKLSIEDVKNIRERKLKGEKPKEVYSDYSDRGISYNGFYSVWKERTWKGL